MALMGTLVSSAQADAQFSQYYDVPSFYNPAAIGLVDSIHIRGGGKLQWVGIENAPQTFTGVANMPFKFLGKRLAVGVKLAQESQGLYNTLDLGAQLGYKFKKFGGEWTIAVQAGLYDQSFKGSEVYLPDGDDYHQGTDDGIPTSDIHGSSLDLGAGIWYQHPKFWAGVSATHLNNPTVTMIAEGSTGASEGVDSETKYVYTANRTLYFMAGSNIPLSNTLFEIVPSVLFKSDFTFTTAEITARLRYRRFLSFGVGYRWKDAVIATVSAQIKSFFIGYSFDYATTAINRASSGSHEIFVGYTVKLDLSDRNRHRHKSVRLL